MNRLRLALSAVAAASLLAAAGCASSSSPQPTAAGTDHPATVNGVSCTWGPPGNPSAPKTGTPAATVPNSGAATMTIVTNRGSIVIKVDRGQTPCTVASFAYLAGKHFFDKTPCHRLTTNGIYVLQCGDPTGTGTGGPAYTIPDEGLPPDTSAPKTYPRGSVAMANTGQPNSGGSQFFLVYKDSPLTAAYTQFGTITSGLDLLDKIAAAGDTGSNGPGDGAPKESVQILSMTVTAG
ncbi:MAG TPA: peptidylprolyl isomerase [Micromonosporaceae bacterium]